MKVILGDLNCKEHEISRDLTVKPRLPMQIKTKSPSWRIGAAKILNVEAVLRLQSFKYRQKPWLGFSVNASALTGTV